MMAGGRLYNRAGMRPLFLASMALHSLGVAALAGVTAATDTWLLVAAYGLMGLGGGMAQTPRRPLRCWTSTAGRRIRPASSGTSTGKWRSASARRSS